MGLSAVPTPPELAREQQDPGNLGESLRLCSFSEVRGTSGPSHSSPMPFLFPVAQTSTPSMFQERVNFFLDRKIRQKAKESSPTEYQNGGFCLQETESLPQID